MRDAKSTLRDAMRRRRRDFVRDRGGQYGKAIAEIFAGCELSCRLEAGAVVAAYWPVGDEADVRPLMADLHGRGLTCVLPVVIGRNQPLVFREWRPGLALDGGVLSTRHPPTGSAEHTPNLLLVPLLAFDRKGWRVGQGGGYYDRTLAAMRAVGPAVAVGVGLSCQEVEAVPHGPHDIRLDWVVTEQEAFEAVENENTVLR